MGCAAGSDGSYGLARQLPFDVFLVDGNSVGKQKARLAVLHLQGGHGLALLETVDHAFAQTRASMATQADSSR